MAAAYGGVILERFRRPRYFGGLPDAEVSHEEVNPLCGDRLRVDLRLGSRGEIAAVRFQGDACAIATASADLLAEMVEGRGAAEAARVDRDALVAALGAPIRPSRLQCVALPVTALRAALERGPGRAASEPAPEAPPGGPGGAR